MKALNVMEVRCMNKGAIMGITGWAPCQHSLPLGCLSGLKSFPSFPTKPVHGSWRPCSPFSIQAQLYNERASPNVFPQKMETAEKVKLHNSLQMAERGNADMAFPLSFSTGNRSEDGQLHILEDDRQIESRYLHTEGRTKKVVKESLQGDNLYLPQSNKQRRFSTEDSKIGTGDPNNQNPWSNEKLEPVEGCTDIDTFLPNRENQRIIKRSKLIAKQIISQSSALCMGFVTQILSNPQFKVLALEVKPSLLYGQGGGVLIGDVCQVGDVILIRDDAALENELNALDCETFVGYDLITEEGYYLGKVRDYSLSLMDGTIVSLEFDLLGITLIPSNMISTYWLSTDEVLDTSFDSLLVKKGAENRARRLTKGFWKLPIGQEKSRNQRPSAPSRYNMYLRKRGVVEGRGRWQQANPLQAGNIPSSQQNEAHNEPELIIKHGYHRSLPIDYTSSNNKYDII